MAGLNQLQLIQLLRRTGNPQAVIQQIAQSTPLNPQLQGLIQMAQRGDQQGIRQYAEQFFRSQGRDLNTEMQNFLTMLGRA